MTNLKWLFRVFFSFCSSGFYIHSNWTPNRLKTRNYILISCLQILHMHISEEKGKFRFIYIVSSQVSFTTAAEPSEKQIKWQVKWENWFPSSSKQETNYNLNWINTFLRVQYVKVEVYTKYLKVSLNTGLLNCTFIVIWIVCSLISPTNSCRKPQVIIWLLWELTKNLFFSL